MILIKASSDLCNIMFQYAFGFTTARRLGTSFCLNRLRDFSAFDLDSLFELGGDTGTANTLRKLRFKLASLTRRPVEKRWLDFNDGRYAAPETVLADLSDHAFYRGYFQSSRYFEGFETEVKNLFLVKEPLRLRFERRYADYLRGAPLGILHFRGKAHGAWERVRLPWSYYENCLERVPNRENYRWLVLTDDVDFVHRNFPEASKLEIVSGEVIDDFQLMSRATIHIMATSTFSWWAAYLNPNPAARIMGPKYWYGHRPEYHFEAPEGIMHPAWEWVDTGATKVART